MNLARELKKLWNIKVTFIPIVNGAFGTVNKRLLKGLGHLEIRVRVETIQTTTLLKPARILRRVLETKVDLMSFKFSERQPVNADVKNPQGVVIIIIIM